MKISAIKNNVRSTGATTMRNLGKMLLLLSVFILLPACSGDGFTSGVQVVGTGASGVAPTATCTADPTLPGCTVTANFLSLSLTSPQVNSDGQDSTSVTATILDVNRAAVEGVQVTFSADLGRLSSSVAFTDANGQAVVEFSADPANPSNQIATVTATVTDVGSASIPIEIIGTTLLITMVNTSLQVPLGDTTVVETVTVTAKDSGGKPIYNVPVIFTIATTGTAVVTASVSQGATDVRGEIQLTLTASGSGTAVFTAQGLGALVSQDLLISDLNLNNPFRITAPTVDPVAVISGGVSPADRVAITVEADPALGITNVLYTTSIGAWLSTGLSTSTLGFGGTATDTLISAAEQTGFATVVISDAADPTVFDTITVAMSPPPDQAAVIFIQSDVNVLPLSIGSSVFTANIEATVKTADPSNYPVFNVPVVFTIEGAPGGGEVLTRSFGVTDLNGVVRTQFTSGILPSAQDSVKITAAVVAAPLVNDTIIVAIGGVGGSVSLGTSPFLEVDEADTSIYRLDMSAAVADSTGASVAGSNVTLSVWPESYRTGAWYDHDPDPDQEECIVYYSGPPFRNEDLDEDLILDLDSTLILAPPATASEDTNQDGALTPHNSTAGTVPSLVVTDAEGIGAYQLVFQKQYANWIDVRARGRTKVQGTETTGTLYFNLPVLRAEAENCDIAGGGANAASPFDLTVIGAHGQIANLMGPGGVDSLLPWKIPAFEGNRNVGYSAGRGLVEFPGLAAPTTLGEYRIAGNSSPAVPFEEYIDTINISADPFACALASCGQLGVTIRVRVITTD